MGSRKITVKQSAADSISEIAWFVQSKGMVKTAEKFPMMLMIFFLRSQKV
jgi:hypothetical protein